MKSYTYLIKHIPTGKVYYGVRFANKVDPTDDLWKIYFTSSIGVKKLIEETGEESFLVEVRRTFDTKEEAVLWETKVLRRCKVLQDDRWLNANIAGYIFPSEEIRKKMSVAQRNRVTSEETKKKLSEVQKGSKRPWAIQNLPKDVSGDNNGMYGKQHSDITKQRISKANKGRDPWNKGKTGLQVAHNKGKKMSEEQKAKLSAARRAYCERRKSEKEQA
jgi:hypothetical protein